MVQGYTQQDCGSKGGWSSGLLSKDPKEEAHLPEQSSTETKPSCVRILVELRMTNGLHISQKNLNYQELKQLIEKLEGLCLM